MGIHSLHQILQKYAPNCYTEKHISFLSEKKIAIDISLYLYKYKASSGERWLECFLGMIQCLRKWNIHPIFIYDGKAPQEKFDEQTKRRQSKIKLQEKIQLLEKEIEDYEKDGLIGPMIDEMCYVNGPSLFRTNVNKKFQIQIAKDKLKSLKGNIIQITEEDINLTKELFTILSIPYIEAPGEAECFASHLCVYGYVDAVLSEDTDVLVYQTPLSLSKLDTLNHTVIEIDYKQMINELGFTSDMFTDMCIMCSCDYNTNIPLIGPEKSYQLIKEHHTIEAVIEILSLLKNKDGTPKYTESDFTKLNHSRCRELFTTQHELVSKIKNSFYTGEPDHGKLGEFFFTNRIYYSMDSLLKNMKCVEIEFN
jgi:flap endonuclease-1